MLHNDSDDTPAYVRPAAGAGLDIRRTVTVDSYDDGSNSNCYHEPPNRGDGSFPNNAAIEMIDSDDAADASSTIMEASPPLTSIMQFKRQLEGGVEVTRTRDVADLAGSSTTARATSRAHPRHSRVPCDFLLHPSMAGGGTLLSRTATVTTRSIQSSSSFCFVFAHFLQALRDTPPLRLLWVGVLVVMLMCGSAMQIIFLNFWLRQFPADGAPGNYTTFVVSASLFSTLFLIALGLCVLIERPNLRFFRTRRSIKLLLFVGLMDTLNSALAVYAASHTPEVLQALFVAMVPVYAALLTKSVLKDPRNYMNPWIVCSFICIIAGIMIASAYHIGGNSPGEEEAGQGNSTDSPSDQRRWSFLFFISVPFAVLMNVGQTLYMIRYTRQYEKEESLAAPAVAAAALRRHTTMSAADAGVNPGHSTSRSRVESGGGGDGAGTSISVYTPASLSTDTEHDDGEGEAGGNVLYGGGTPWSNAAQAALAEMERTSPPGSFGDDTVVKLVMLASGTSLQMLMALMWLPLDALPWFGGSGSVGEAVANFQKGIHSVLYYPHNLTYCCLYSSGFVLVYVAAAYLNQYSVTLCSMVNQMSAPITALVLIIFPSLNLTGSVAPWYMSTIAILLLTAGTFVYVVWDTNTAAAKEEGELQLRLEMLGLLGSGRRAEYALVVEQEEDEHPTGVSGVAEGRRGLR